MSAYIVEDKTIYRIVTWLKHQKKERYIRRKLRELGFEDDFDKDGNLKKTWEQKLTEAMFKLNQDAVVQRYGKLDDYAKKGHKIKFKIECSNQFQVLKSLHCWTYQCSEGDIPDRELFKFFDNEVDKSLMYDIINGIDEYEKAEWG